MHVFIDGVALSVRQFGGVRRYWTYLIQELAELGIILTLYADCMDALPTTHGRLQFMRRRTFRGRRRFPIDNVLLDWALARVKCDIFHSSYYSYPFLGSIPSVVTAFDMMHERFPQYFSRPGDRRFVTLKRRAFENATHIIAISESTKEDIIALCDIPAENISVIHLGVEECFSPVEDEDALQSFRKRHCLEDPYLLFVGTRHYYKNFAALLKAFFLSGLDRDSLLVAFGSEPVWREEEIGVLGTYGKGQQSRVRLGGYLGNEELILAYSAASCLVYPSLYEGFGLPVLEAMACGIPVICGDNSSLREVGGEVAIYIDGDDLDSMVAALRNAVTEDQSERVERELKWAKEFTWRKTAMKTLSVYQTLVVNSGQEAQD